VTTSAYVPGPTRSTKPEDRLVRRIKGLEERLDALSRTPQLTSSAIDDGSVLVTAGGQLTGNIGQQFDGTSGYVVVAGPTPPVPSGLTALTVPGGIKVKWDGSYADPQTGFSSPVVAPLDFARVDVEVDTDPSFPNHLDIGDPNSGSILSAAGGEITVAWPTSGTALYVRLRVRSTAGKRSNPSQTATVTSGTVGLGDLGFDLASYAASNTIVYTTGAQPANPDRVGTLWVKQISAGPPPKYETWRWTGASWQLLQDQGVTTALANAAAAQTAADTKAKLFAQAATPTYSGAANTAYWIDTSAGGGNVPKVWNGTAWVPYQLGNGAIQPNSLVASNVVATGTITAALFEALLVLTTAVIAGNASGDHARLDGQGLRIFVDDPVDHIPNQAGALGTSSSDFLSLTDSAGHTQAALSDVGGASFTALTVTSDPVFRGKNLTTIIAEQTNGKNYRGSWYLGDFASRSLQVRSEIGIVQFVFPIIAGHSYEITVVGPFTHWGPGWLNGYPGQTAGTASEMQLGYKIATTTSQTPVNATVSSTDVNRLFFQGVPDYGWQNPSADFTYDATVTGQASLLITQLCNFGTTATASHWGLIRFSVTDLGPATARPVTYNNGGGTWYVGTAGTVSSPKRQYDTGELTPAGWASFTGSNVLRTDTADVVQGYDPSGFNGDGWGYWWFNIPSITGTVDEAWIYLYANHWYYNSGGTALVFMSTGTGQNNPAVTATFPHAGWPVNAGWWLRLGQTDADYFKTGTNGFGVGTAHTTNGLYYGRFYGPLGRLRILYTQ
jgi:hypothetical protein